MWTPYWSWRQSEEGNSRRQAYSGYSGFRLDGGSNSGVGVIPWVLSHNPRDSLWKQQGVVGRHFVIANSDDDVVAFSES